VKNKSRKMRGPEGREKSRCADRKPLAILAVAIHLALGSTLTASASAMAASTPRELSDLSLEDLLKVEVTSASKYSQSSREAPSAVQVISAEDIRRYGWRTLAEALQSLPGVYVSSDRAYTFVGARGFLVAGDYNTRFLLLLDGQRLNDNVYEQANFGNEFPLDLALVDRIEYVPGPGSSIYGSNAMFGVINVITRHAGTSPKLALSSSIGSFRDRSIGATAQYRANNDGPGILLSVSRAIEDKRDTAFPQAIGLPTTDGSPSADGVARSLDNQVVERAFLRYTQGNFSASLWTGTRRVQPSTALYGSNFNDNRLAIKDVSSGAMAEYSRTMNDNLKLVARMAYQHFEYRATYPYVDNTIGPYVVGDLAVGDWINGEGRLLYTGLEGHKLMIGGDIQTDRQAQQKTRDIDVDINPAFDVNEKTRRSSIYAQDEWTFASGWLLNTGVRHDQYSGRQSTTSPRLALIWNASDQATFKLLGGRAYRVANAYERLYEGVGYLASPALNPETVRTIEAVGEYRFGGNQQIAVSLFDYKLDNLISQVPLDSTTFQYQNQPAATVRGMEATYRLRTSEGLNLSTSLALNNDRASAQESASGSPRWIAKFRGSHPLFSPKVIGALEINAISSRQFVSNGRPLDLGTEVIANLTVTAADVLPGLDAQFKVANLLDRKSFNAAPNETSITRIPQYGRHWSLNLLYGF
jgi:outer membrane receptor protein involved in Fe transport